MAAYVRMSAALAFALLALLPSFGHAQSWPQRNVKLIVPLGPSSGADIAARLLAERLQSRWNVPVIVENRAGGDGVVGITTFLGANDDHTLLFGPSGSFTAHPYMRTTMPYNAADIVPIVRTTVTVVAVAVPTSLGVKTMAEFVALARQQPGKLNWSTVNGINDFQFMALVKTAAIDAVRVPYRDVVQAVNDLAENRIQIYCAAYATLRPMVESGKLRIIALTNTSRVKFIPDVPTTREAGFPALEFDGLVGIYGTPAVPVPTRQKIETDVLEVLKDPVIADRITATGTVIAPGTTAEFIAAIETQKVVAAQSAKVLGLKAAE